MSSSAERSGVEAGELSAETFRELTDAMPQIVWVASHDGRVLWINRRWTELTGLSAESSRGDGWARAIHPDDFAKMTGPRSAAIASGRRFEHEIRVRLTDGTYRWHLARTAPASDAASDDRRWFGTATDIDDRKRAEEDLAALMDAVPAAVWIARDPECREVVGNRWGYELLRVRRGGNLSKTAADPSSVRHFTVLRDGVEVEPDRLPLQVVAREGVEVRDWEEELRFDDDGSSVFLYGSVVPLRDREGRGRGAVSAFVDVTPLKRAEARLREADRRKDEFLAVLGHELRNPLAPILTAVELMKRRGDVPSSNERAVIERQARHLVRLVDDLLDVSRIARGKVELRRERIELSHIVERAVETAAPLFEQRRHRLSVEVAREGLAVEGDETRLVQVVLNLLSNAARYTPVGGRVSVTAAAEGDEVVLRVRDNGVGIADDLRSRIFEMFVQGRQGLDRQGGGLGLGLALVRGLVEMHGGSVVARSDGEGRGSEFEVRLPSAERAPRSTGHRPDDRVASVERAVNTRRVLIVDDNLDGGELLGEVLASEGHDVRVADGPIAALALVADFRPEVAILDIGLPVMDGYALCAELRAALGAPAPFFIALTGYGGERDRARSAEGGFAVHLVKPVDMQHLLDLILAVK